MSAELRALRESPLDQLLLLEEQLRAARLDIAAGQAQTWTGIAFRMGHDWLVAPKDDVREVIPPPRITRVPNARPWLEGLANVRGELLTIVDLRQFLGLEASDSPKTQRILVLNAARLPAGLRVDEVAGYRQFTVSEQRREIPADGPFAPYLLGAFAREGQAWLALSLHKIARSDGFRDTGQ